jgi:hypothetical protein
MGFSKKKFGGQDDAIWSDSGAYNWTDVKQRRRQGFEDLQRKSSVLRSGHEEAWLDDSPMRHCLQSLYGYWRMEHKRQIRSLSKKCPAPVERIKVWSEPSRLADVVWLLSTAIE